MNSLYVIEILRKYFSVAYSIDANVGKESKYISSVALPSTIFAMNVTPAEHQRVASSRGPSIRGQRKKVCSVSLGTPWLYIQTGKLALPLT